MQALLEHYQEFKKRLIQCVLFFVLMWSAAWCYAPQIYQWIAAPLLAAEPNLLMIYTALGEGFVTYLKIASYTAILLALPIWLWHLYRFIAPGLYAAEKRVIIPCLILSPLLFVLGILLLYYLAMPMIWQFFLSFQSAADSNINIVLQAKMSEYLSLFLELSLAFGLSFQLPIAVIILTVLDIIDAQFLRRQRKYAIVLIFIVAAFLTPPDVISQITLAMPLLLLYEISIIFAKLFKRRKKQNA